jgi:hypothetical protein
MAVSQMDRPECLAVKPGCRKKHNRQSGIVAKCTPIMFTPPQNRLQNLGTMRLMSL